MPPPDANTQLATEAPQASRVGSARRLGARPSRSRSGEQKAQRNRYAVRAALAAAFGIVLIPYAIALGSPLRDFYDGPTYLALANGIPFPGHTYPPGYPELLRIAEHVGLGSAWGFVAVNLALLALAVGAVYILCRRYMGFTPVRSALVCLAVLLAHIVSELTPVLMSDVPYFGFAMLCLLALAEADTRSGRRRAWLLSLAIVLAAAAISIRIAGIALVPPVLVVAIGRPRLMAWWRLARRDPARTLTIAAASLLTLVVLGFILVRVSPYHGDVSHTFRTGGGPGAVFRRVGTAERGNLMNLGEILLQTNCCQRVSTTLHLNNAGLVSWGFAVAGLGLIALVLVGWRVRRRFGPIEVFMLSTAAVCACFPIADTRYWIAILPFIIAYGIVGLERFALFKAGRVAVAAYVLLFATVGGVWLAQEVRISTAGRDFPQVASTLMDPRIAASYRVAFGEARPGDLRAAKPLVVNELRRYEPLTRGGTG